MVPYLGDFAEDATLYLAFNTFDSNDPSGSVTVTDLVAGDVKITKNRTTTKATSNGITVTLNIGTGNGRHMVDIDTSNDTGDVGFWVTGADYHVNIEGATVDGGTVNAWIGHFSIENRTTFPKADFPTNFASMGIEADGHVHGDVKEWVGNTVTASAGNPDVNVESIDDIDAPATWKASINTEVDTALNTTTYSEPGQGAPTASPTIRQMVHYLYKSWRNKKDNDGSTTNLYADDGTKVDHKQTTSESGGTVTKAEWITGA